MVTCNSPLTQFWVGTSGFSYPDWVGPFYPPRTRPTEMLSFYARRFPIVELNFTFYRMPTAGAFEHMLRRTPDGFQFLVKMSSEVTHARNWSCLGQFLEALEPLCRTGRMAGVLCQFPQSFHRTRVASSYLRQLANRLAGYSAFVEFRHQSWYTARLIHELAVLNLGIVSVDVPPLSSLFPRRLLGNGRTIYVRFHSRQTANWYAGDKDRYDYLYSREELDEWLDEIQQLMEETERVYLLFNNCRKAQAAQNAAQVQRILEQRFGPNANAVPAVPSSGLVQPSLFTPAIAPPIIHFGQ